MATQDSLDRVQQLYVAYYGRPADQEGQEYWADRLDAEGESAIINAFGNSEEYTALAEGQGNATLVNNLYQQAFGRDADPEGLAYYTGVLADGEKSLAEIAVTITNAAQGIDQQTFSARVEAAAAYTAEFGAQADYDVEAGKAAVEAAKPGVDASALTEALGTLQTAQDSVETFLEDARSNEALQENQGVEADTDVATVRTAIGTEYDASAEIAANGGAATVTNYAGTDVTLSAFIGDDNFADRSVTVQDALTSDAKAEAEKAVTDFEAAIAAVDGLGLAVRNYNSAQEDKTAADTALTEAQDDTSAATAAFGARDNSIAEADLIFDTSGAAVGSAYTDANFGGGDTMADVAQVVLQDGTTGNVGTVLITVENGEFIIADDQVEVGGISALRDALQAEYDAQLAADAAAQDVLDADSALDALDTEVAAEDFVQASDGTTAVDTGLGVANELAAREETLTDLTAAIERFENARSLSDELESLDESVTEASDAITDAEDGLGVDLFTAEDVVTGTPDTLTVDAGDDVILFSEDLDGVSVASFANDGEDRLYFGEGFNLVQLDEAWDETADTGSSADLEIFWEQNGGDLTLYVENQAFAGNSSGAADITQVTLTGVNAEDITFEGGYLTAGEVA